MNNRKVIFVDKEEIFQDNPRKIPSQSNSKVGSFNKKPQTVVNLPPLSRKYVRLTNRQELSTVRQQKQEDEMRNSSGIIPLKNQSRQLQNNLENLSHSVEQHFFFNQTPNSIDTKKKPPTEDFCIFDALKPCQASKYEYAQSISSGNTSEQYSIIEQDEFLTSFNQKFMNSPSDQLTEELKQYSGLFTEWEKEQKSQSGEVGDTNEQQKQSEKWKNEIVKSSQNIKIPSPGPQIISSNDQIPTPNQSLLKSRKYSFQVQNYLNSYYSNESTTRKQDYIKQEIKVKTIQAKSLQKYENSMSEIDHGKNELMDILEEDSFYESSHTQLSFLNQNQRESILKDSNHLAVQSDSHLKSNSRIKSNSNVNGRLLIETYEVKENISPEQIIPSHQMEASKIPKISHQNNQMSCSIERGMLNNYSIIQQQASSEHVHNTFSDELQFASKKDQEYNFQNQNHYMVQGKFDNQASLERNLSETPYGQVNRDELSSQQLENRQIMDSQFIEENPDDQIHTVESGYMITEKSSSYIRISEDQIHSQVESNNRIDHNNVSFYSQEEEMISQNHLNSSSVQRHDSQNFPHILGFNTHSQKFYQHHMDYMDQIIIEILEMKKQFQLFYLNSINQKAYRSDQTNKMILEKLNSIQAQLNLSVRQNRVFKNSNLQNSSCLVGHRWKNPNQMLYSFRGEQENHQNQEHMVRQSNSNGKTHKPMKESPKFIITPWNQSNQNSELITDSRNNSDITGKPQHEKSVSNKNSQNNYSIPKNHITLQHNRHKSLKRSVFFDDKQNGNIIKNESLEQPLLNEQKNNKDKHQGKLEKCKLLKTDKLIGSDNSKVQNQQKLTAREYQNRLLEEVEHNFKKNRQHKKKFVDLQYSSGQSKNQSQMNRNSIPLSQKQQQKLLKYQKYLKEQSSQYKKQSQNHQNDDIKLHQTFNRQKSSQNQMIETAKKAQGLSSLPCITKVVTPSQLSIAMEKIETHEQKKQALLDQVYQFGHPTEQSKSLVFQNQVKKEQKIDQQKLLLVEKNQLFYEMNDERVKDSFWKSGQSSKNQSKYGLQKESIQQEPEQIKHAKKQQKLSSSKSSQSMLISESKSNSLCNSDNSNHNETPNNVNRNLKNSKLLIRFVENRVNQNSKILTSEQNQSSNHKSSDSNLLDSLQTSNNKAKSSINQTQNKDNQRDSHIQGEHHGSQNGNSKDQNLLDSGYRNLERDNTFLLNNHRIFESSKQSNFLSSVKYNKSSKEQNMLESQEIKKQKKDERFQYSQKGKNLLDSQKSKIKTNSQNSEEQNLLYSPWDGRLKSKKLQKQYYQPHKAKHQNSTQSVRQDVKQIRNRDQNYSAELQNSHNRSLSPLILINQQNTRTLPIELNFKSANQTQSISGLNNTQELRVSNQTTQLVNTTTLLNETLLEQQTEQQIDSSLRQNQPNQKSDQTTSSNQNLLIFNQKQLKSLIKTPHKQPNFTQFSSKDSQIKYPLKAHNSELSNLKFSSHLSGSFAYTNLLQKHIAEYKENQNKVLSSNSIESIPSICQKQAIKEQTFENQRKSWTGFKDLREKIISKKQTNYSQNLNHQLRNSKMQLRRTQSDNESNLDLYIQSKTQPAIIISDSFKRKGDNLLFSPNDSQVSLHNDKQINDQFQSSQIPSNNKSRSVSESSPHQKSQSASIHNNKNEQAHREEQFANKGIREHKIPVICFNKKLKQGQFCRGQTRKIPASIRSRHNIGSNNASNDSNQQQYYSDPISERIHNQNTSKLNLPRINEKEKNDEKFYSLPNHNQSLQILPDSPIYNSLYYDRTDSKTMTYKWFKFNPKSY